jgi:hypothetical protein
VADDVDLNLRGSGQCGRLDSIWSGVEERHCNDKSEIRGFFASLRMTAFLIPRHVVDWREMRNTGALRSAQNDDLLNPTWGLCARMFLLVDWRTPVAISMER